MIKKVIYLAQLELMQKQVLEMDSAALSRSRIEILAGITRLRQICNTPALFMDDYKGSSGNLNVYENYWRKLKIQPSSFDFLSIYKSFSTY